VELTAAAAEEDPRPMRRCDRGPPLRHAARLVVIVCIQLAVADASTV
jgi:hypothetical protein